MSLDCQASYDLIGVGKRNGERGVNHGNYLEEVVWKPWISNIARESLPGKGTHVNKAVKPRELTLGKRTMTSIHGAHL